MSNHLRELLLSILLVGNISILLNEFKAFSELVFSVVSAHVLFKLWEFTRRYVNHIHFSIVKGNWLFAHGLAAAVFLLVVVSVLVLGLGIILWTLLGIWSFRNKAWRFGGGALRIRIQFADVIHVHCVKNSWVLAVLRLVILNLERYHFLFQLFSCFSISQFLGIVFLFLLLSSSEFIENVLIM